MRLGILVIASLLVLATSHVKAQQYVVDPDAFPSGTPIVAAGLTFTDVGFADTVIAFTDPSHATTGTRVFGYGNGTGTAYNDAWNPGEFRVDFASPTNQVSLDFINNDGGAGTDTGALQAFSSSNTSLGFVETSLLVNDGDHATLTFTSATSNIAYILAGGSPNTGDDVVLDHLIVGTSVPEPGSVVLLVACLAGWGFLARRKHTYSMA